MNLVPKEVTDKPGYRRRIILLELEALREEAERKQRLRHQVRAQLHSGSTPAAAADTTAPTVSITAPANAATVSGTVSLSATATDAVGVIGVIFYVDGLQVGAEDLTDPYAGSFDSTLYIDGSHTIDATARDAAGNVGHAAQISVTVSNAPAHLLQDTYTDSNGTGAAAHTPDQGGPYTVDAGSATIQGNKLRIDSNGTFIRFPAAANCTAIGTFTPGSGNGSGWMLRYQDATHHWLLYVSMSGNELDIYEVNAGYTLRASTHHAFATPFDLTAYTNAGNDLHCDADGVSADYNSSLHSGQTKAGIYGDGTGAITTLDNATVDSL